MLIINDFSTSVKKALTEIDPAWESYPGLIVCGTHSPENVEDTIKKLKNAREKDIPTLGICFGMQLMAVEYARNALDLRANSEEVDPHADELVVKKLDELRVGIREVEHSGAVWPESHWHHYAFNNDYMTEFEPEWEFTTSRGIVEIMRYKPNKHYIGVQFHPEYQSSPGLPHPILVSFLNQFKHEPLEM